MSQVKLKDVLHLYLGCDIECVNENCQNDMEYVGMIRKISPLLLDKYMNGNWKPVLRPLNSVIGDLKYL